MNMPVKSTHLLIMISLLLFSANNANCMTIKNVDIPEKITQPASKQTLVLNGAGIRSKFFFSIYIGALYLPFKQTTVASILQSDQPGRVMMHCLYHEIDKDELVDAWNEGFKENTSKQDMKQLRERIAAFNKLFPELHKGDMIILDYIPNKGTTLTFNGRTLGRVPGKDFNTALLKVWLGEHPADRDLKAAMLGRQ